LFVYALYDRYLQEGSKIYPEMEQALSAGGSISPTEIGEKLGLNVAAPDFWRKGTKVFKRFVDELEKIV
jgi:oligoendopeptidase F